MFGVDDFIQIKAWAAGFFDGEGCILLSREGPGAHYLGFRLRITVGQRYDTRPLFLLKKYWGGHVHKDKNSNSRWVCKSDKAIKFLQDTLPNLIVKHDQALIAIDFRKYMIENKYKKAKAQERHDYGLGAKKTLTSMKRRWR
jgi:hypothetical protein